MDNKDFEQNEVVKNAEHSNNCESKSAKGNTLLLYLHDLVYLIAVVLLIFSLCLRIVVVSGPSMKATLLDGDWLLVLSNSLYRDPQPGDVIVVSKDSFDDEPIIKRVIATEGQTVDIDFTAGVVYVNGEALKESYTLTPTNLAEGTVFPLTVDEGCVFVLGDNRNESKDSRSPQIGLVDCREILGKAIFLFIPGNDGGTVERDSKRIGVVS